jgi:predicted DNA-binding protein YlxM (UPF0122 family)
MIKILNAYKWLGDELGDNTKEIDLCLEKGLIKYTYGTDNLQPNFIVLESNIPAVKEILGDDYYRMKEETISQWLYNDFYGCYEDLVIENAFGDKIEITIDTICDLISDEEEVYFPNEEKLKIYNADVPADEVKNMLDEIGREQAKAQIKDLLNSIMEQGF